MVSFQTEVPKGTFESWMDTPYAQLIARTVRSQVHAEYQHRRDFDLGAVQDQLEEQARLRAEAEQRLEEVSQRLLVIPPLEEKIRHLKMSLLRVADKGAGAGLLANAHSLLRDIVHAWHVHTLRRRLEESYRTRPRPNLAECRSEIDDIKAAGEKELMQLHSVMHEQIERVTRRHLDLEKYQEGRAPPAPQAGVRLPPLSGLGAGAQDGPAAQPLSLGRNETLA